MKNNNYINSLFEFINASPSAYHAVAEVKARLLSFGYTELSEAETWNISDGGKYFVTRAGSSVIAFRAKATPSGFMICASHSDSPAFRIKICSAERGAYVKIPVEKYGGMLFYPWFDRPLSVAGRVLVKTGNSIKSVLVNIDRDLLVIPSVAIHFNRAANDGFKANPAVDLIPLFANSSEKRELCDIIADEIGVKSADIVSHDLFLYVRDKATRLGANGEFILSPRLDDLECVYTSLEAFLAADGSDSIPLLAVFDNEEVGSETKQGAASTFLYDTLERISGSRENYLRLVAGSFMVSADNAHAKHPNHPELSDTQNAPLLNGGIVVKYNANQRYATDGMSASVFDAICESCGAKTQKFYNRPDIPGGTTLGTIANTSVPVLTVDIGLPQLAMHSAVETAGAGDVSEMIKALTEFYSTSIVASGEEIVLKKK